MSVKIRRQKRKSRLILFATLLTLLLIFFVGRLFNKETEVEWNKYLVIGKKNIFVTYDSKLALRIPEDVYIGNERNVEDYIKKGQYSELYQRINSVFPEEIEGYVVPNRRGQYSLEPEYAVNIPLINKDGKNYILTSELNEVFLKLYYDEEIRSQVVENVLIDILNANGRSGYAGKLGNQIKDNFNYEYNAANYQELTDYSYVIANNIGENQLKEFIMSLDEKYIRVKEKGDLPTLANIVLILGREESNLLDTYIYKYDAFDKENYELLKDNGYKNVRRLKNETEIDKSFIEYKKEDYYIAYKISKLLNIDNLLENNEISDRINIYIK